MSLGIIGEIINAMKNTAITKTIIKVLLINLTIINAIKRDEIRVISAVNIDEAEILVKGSSSSVFPCISRILLRLNHKHSYKISPSNLG